MEIALLFLCIGAIAGLLAGLFGLGGGVVMVPALYLTIRHFDIAHVQIMHLAVGTSLAVMVVNSLDSAYTHQRRGDLLWPEVRKIGPYVAFGALAAALASRFVPSDALRYLFLCMLAYVIGRAFLKKDFSKEYQQADFVSPGPTMCGGFGLFMGAISALLGIGGSVLTIPFLRRAKLPMVNASAIGATLAVPVALCGVGGYIATGWGEAGLPSWSSGYVFWPAAGGLMIGSLVGVPIGTRLSHRFSDKVSAGLYKLVLIAAFVGMLF